MKKKKKIPEIEKKITEIKSKIQKNTSLEEENGIPCNPFLRKPIEHFCRTCGAPIDIEFRRNLNRKSLILWEIWRSISLMTTQEIEYSSYMQWIPEEVMEIIFTL
jgi:hypothetical protein